MSTISLCAQLACRDIYNPESVKEFTHIYSVGSTLCGLKITHNKCYIVCQGTVDREDWFDNVDLEMYEHPVLGGLHSGFHKNLSSLLKQLLLDLPIGTPIICTGHSKGAAEASQLAAELWLLKFPIEECILFASPHAGDNKFSQWMRDNINGVSFRNAIHFFTYRGHEFEWGDPVTELPFLQYVATYHNTIITNPPSGWLKKINAISWHHANLYYTYCKNL